MGWQQSSGWRTHGWRGAAAAAGDSAAATNFLARTSGLNTTHTNAYKTLLNGLTTDGFFDGSGNSLKLDALVVLGTQDSTTAALNLIANRYNYTMTGATFTADQGVVALSASGNGDTGFNISAPSAGSPFYTQNSASIGVWVRTAGSTQDTAQTVSNGGLTSPSETGIYARFSDGNCYARINDSPSFGGTAVASSVGFTVGNRSSSTGREIYRDGSSIASGSETSAASANSSLFVGNAVDQQIFAYSIGGSLSSTDVSNLYSRLHTFGLAVGAL